MSSSTPSPASRWSRRSARNIGRPISTAIAALLKPGGRAALQFISIRDALFDGYAASADFIQTYIFPGGMLIDEPRFAALAERAGLELARTATASASDYAETLKRWRARYDAAVDGRAAARRLRRASSTASGAII